MAAFGSVSSSAISPEDLPVRYVPFLAELILTQSALWPAACEQVGGEPLQGMNSAPTDTPWTARLLYQHVQNWTCSHILCKAHLVSPPQQLQAAVRPEYPCTDHP